MYEYTLSGKRHRNINRVFILEMKHFHLNRNYNLLPYTTVVCKAHLIYRYSLLFLELFDIPHNYNIVSPTTETEQMQYQDEQRNIYQ